jgi:hypothetical protein
MRQFSRSLVALLAALPLALAVPGMAHAAPCRDAKGHFAKCPGAAVKTTTKTTTKAAAKPAPAPAAKVTKVTVKKGPCKDAKGKFVKCK